MIVNRYDYASGSVASHRRTPQGGLIADARLTRTGVLSYLQPDGSSWREFRPPEEVFHADSLATLAHAPLTIDHPAIVTPNNWKGVAVGHVAGMPERDGDYVAAPLRIHDADAIDKTESGDLQELSCGYACALDKTPGVYRGESYDAIQRNIRYNHVAAGPAGWGRAGPEVRMRLDGGCAVSGWRNEDPWLLCGAPTDTFERERGQDPLAAAVQRMQSSNKHAWRTVRRHDRRR